MALRKGRLPAVFVAVVAVATSGLALTPSVAGATVASAQSAPAAHHDTSPPLRDIPPAPRAGGQRVIPVRPVRPQAPSGRDPVVQSSAGPLAPALALVPRPSSSSLALVPSPSSSALALVGAVENRPRNG